MMVATTGLVMIDRGRQGPDHDYRDAGLTVAVAPAIAGGLIRSIGLDGRPRTVWMNRAIGAGTAPRQFAFVVNPRSALRRGASLLRLSREARAAPTGLMARGGAHGGVGLVPDVSTLTFQRRDGVR